MSSESKEDESEPAAHLRQLAEDMPEVRVAHAGLQGPHLIADRVLPRPRQARHGQAHV